VQHAMIESLFIMHTSHSVISVMSAVSFQG
jgi:hypothetical protein